MTTKQNLYWWMFGFLFLTLIWNGVPPFHVWYAPTADQPIQNIATVQTNAYTVTNAAAQGYFTVSTFDNSGDYFPIWTTNLPLLPVQPAIQTVTTATAAVSIAPPPVTAPTRTIQKLVSPKQRP